MSSRPSAQQDSLIEKGVLASVLDDSETAGAIAEILNPTDFNEPRNELIYKKVIEFYQAGNKFDILQIAQSMSDDGDLSRVGGIQYFMELIDPEAVYANADPVGYALLVQEASRKRQLDIFGQSVAEKTMPGSGYDADKLIAFAQTQLRDFAESSMKGDVSKAEDLVDDAFELIKYKSEQGDVIASGVPSGFIDLDNKTAGFRAAQMIIVAGRPGMGKTSVALDFARNSAVLADKTVLFFSLEMGEDEVMQKLLSAQAHVEFEKIKKGQNLTPDDWVKLESAREELRATKLYIDDNPKLTMTSLRAKCLKQLARPEGLDMVIVDYLQLMDIEMVGDNRQVAVSELSRSVKLLAKELGVPVIILSQLNRGLEQRSDKTPMPSDLRESGALEQDADIILFIHRPEVYDPNDRPGTAELIIAKHRGGPTGKVVLIPLLEYSKFANGTGKFGSDAPDDENAPPAPEEGEDPFADNVPEDPYENVPVPFETANVSEPDSGGEAW